MTPPQERALQYLRAGWRCDAAGKERPRFRNLVSSRFHRDGHHVYVSDTTLASLERQGCIAWEDTILTLAWDQSTLPGWTLVLTEAGHQAVAVSCATATCPHDAGYTLEGDTQASCATCAYRLQQQAMAEGRGLLALIPYN